MGRRSANCWARAQLHNPATESGTCRLTPDTYIDPVTGEDRPNVTGLSDRLARMCERSADGVNGGASLGGSLSLPSRHGPSRNSSRVETVPLLLLALERQGIGPGSGLTDFLFGMQNPLQSLGMGFSEGQLAPMAALGVNGKLEIAGDWPSGMVSLTNGRSSVFGTFSYERREFGRQHVSVRLR